MTTETIPLTQDQGGARPTDQALVSDQARAGLDPAGFDPSRVNYRFDAVRGARHLRSGFWCVEPSDDGGLLWWDYDSNRWVSDLNNPSPGPFGSTAPCRSFAAFKRHIRKHYRELRGRHVRLVSSYVGYDIHADLRDSDSRRMAETGTGSVRSTASAGPTAIAQPSSEPTP